MSFARSRASAFAALLATPVIQISACSTPERTFGDALGRGGQSSAGGTTAKPDAGETSNPEAGQPGNGGVVGAGGMFGQAGEIGEGGAPNGGTTGRGGAGTVEGGAITDGGMIGEGGETSPSGGTNNTSGGMNAGGTIGAGGGITIDGGTLGAGGILSGFGGLLGNGGVSSGGTVGAGGTIGSGGKLNGGTTSLGGTTSAGGKSSGGATSAGGKSSGGTSSSGGTTSACIPTGGEVCTDGIDNDCNGFVDCLQPVGSFPDPDGAAAGRDVRISFSQPRLTVQTFQCRSARGRAVPNNQAWAACPSGAALNVMPRTAAESSNAATNGLWATQVRAVFSDGKASDPFQFIYYMHSSMDGARTCSTKPDDKAFFDAARNILRDAGAFGSTVVARSPFISMTFTPSMSTSFRFDPPRTGNVVKVMSLRRRFVRSADDKFLLIERNYVSNRSGLCKAVTLRTHDTKGYSNPNETRFFLDDCDVLVLNKAGAGACLYVDGSNIVQQRPKHVNYWTQTAPFSATADNFAYSKLLDRDRDSDGFLHFMPKCTTANCATGKVIFLPDRDAYFNYF